MVRGTTVVCIQMNNRYGRDQALGQTGHTEQIDLELLACVIDGGPLATAAKRGTFELAFRPCVGFR